MIRADHAGLMDFSRAILMRVASDFDRAPPGESTLLHLETDDAGFGPAITSIFLAGAPIIK